MGGLISLFAGNPYSLFAVDAHPHISTQPCLYVFILQSTNYLHLFI